MIARKAAVVARDAAERRPKQAEGLVDFMLGDLNDKLSQVQRLDILETVDDHAMKYFQSLPTADVTGEALAQRAKALQKIGSVRLDQAVIEEWIGTPGQGGQLDYYARKTSRLSRTYAMARSLGRTCLFIGISIGIFLALFQSKLGPDNTTLLVLVMGVLAIIAAARESYAYRKGDKQLTKQYRYMHSIFANARTKLDATSNGQSQREILRALGEAALAEHAEWALMHRERPLENARS